MNIKTLHIKEIKLFVFPIIGILFMGCKQQSDINKLISEPPLKVGVVLDREAYSFKGCVKTKITLANERSVSIEVEELSFRIVNISNGSSSLSRELKGTAVNWESKSFSTIDLDIDLPKRFNPGAYGVYVKQKVEGFVTIEEYITFFRIIDHGEITVFDIKAENYKGVPVFKLDGGMSAEYTIEKSAENLTSGISHSWEVNAAGSGPNHVVGTPSYLEKSVNKTVDFYNETLGEDAIIETVLISSGIPSVPYISYALKAIVLPLHFLVSVNTVKEIQSILKTANANGIPSYATLGYDPSVPYAVAWVKLLAIPKAYINFIKDHKVKNVIILGVRGTSGGETKAKQLLYDNGVSSEYADKSIYIMYPGTSADDAKTLNTKIVDLKDFKQQDDFIQISDWESGINQKQLTNFSKNTKAIDSSILVCTITSEDLTRLYSLGTFSSLALRHKNKEIFGDINGVIFNPYLISHPVIEAKKGFVPLLYWQLVGANYTVYNLENDVFSAIKHYYPNTNVKNLKLWLNSTRNFGGIWSVSNLKKELVQKGYTHFIDNNYEVDEVWDLSNGIDAPNELLYEEIDKGIGFKSLKKWNDSVIPLTIEDIKEISIIFGGFEVETK